MALFITHIAPRLLAQPLGYVIDLLAAIPSIVYGLWGIAVLGPASVPVTEWMADNLGFIPALAIVILTTSLAGGEFYWKEIVIEMIVLIAGCWAIFIYGLELPFPLFWNR